MLRYATELGANAIIPVSYDTVELMNGASEVLGYGPEVVVERQA